MPGVSMNEGRRAAACRLRLCLLGVCLLGLAGCGGRYIRINLDRPADLNQPAWVGAYFLSQESALNNIDNIQLADPNGVSQPGIVHKEVFPLYPGDQAHMIDMSNYDPQIRWIVIAAGFADAKPCARTKIPVEDGAKLKIGVRVLDDCIVVTQD